MELNEIYTWAWGAWLAAFAIIEGLAVKNRKKGDTLSAHVWKWFGVRGEKSPPRRVLLGLLMALGSAHFFDLI